MPASRDKLFALAAHGVASASRLVLGLTLARLTGADVYGTCILLLTVETVVATLLASVWMQPTITVASGRPTGERDALLRHALRTQTSVAAGVAVLALLVRPWMGLPVGTGVGFAFGLAACVWSSAVFGVCLARFCGRAALGSQVLAGVIPLAVVPLVHVTAGPVFASFWWARAAGFTVAAVVALVWMRLGRTADESPPDEALGRAKRMGRQMLVGSFANSVCSRTQPFVLGAAVASTEVALYGAASTLVGPLRMLAGAVGSILRPRMALHHERGDTARARAIFRRAVGGLVLLGVALGLGSVVAGDAVARWTFGPEFAGLAWVLPWAAAYATLDAITSGQAVALQTACGAALTTQLRVAAGATSLAMVYPVCTLWGAAGAFIALLVAEGAYAVVAASVLDRLGQSDDIAAWEASHAEG